ncbi:MAG TPA: hypothetical protein PLM24_00515 [Methanothrix sp.]|nr:hypothetical protein [Methanothrix sp.]HPR65599.1 hypothetical protein [Methanothrix sp.]
MVALAEDMLAPARRLAESKTGHERPLLRRQIDAFDRELYGLTEEDIAIVEDATR